MTREEALAMLGGAGPAPAPPGPELVAPQPLARSDTDLNSWVDETLHANREKNFVQRIIAPEQWPTISTDDKSESSHLMMWGEDETGPYVFPTVVWDEQGKGLQHLEPLDAAQRATKSGELIRFETKEEADVFSREYKRAWRTRRYVDQIGPKIPLSIAAEEDPDKKLRSMGIAERLRVPTDVVADDLEYWERLDLEQRALEASNENPAIAAMIANPDRAPFALKNLVELQDLQSAMKPPEPVEVPPSEFVQAHGERGVRTLELGKLAWKVKDGTATPAERERLTYLRQNPLPPIKDSESAFGAFAQWTAGGAIQTLPIMASSIVGGAEVGALAGVTAAAFASPTGPGAAAAAAAAAPAGFAVGAWMDMTQVEGGLIYLAALDAADQIQLETGERPSEDAMRAISTLGGMAGGGLEALSLGVMARLFPGGKRLVRAFSHEGIKRALASTTTRAALGRFAIKAGESIATESATEMAQQIMPALTEGILRDMTLEGDQNWQPEDFWAQLADAGMSGAGPAIVLAGLGAVTSAAGAQIQHTRASRERLKRLDLQVEAVANSELRVQAPAILHEYLQDTLAQNPQEQTIFIDPRALDVAVGGRAALAKVLPDAAAQMDEAMTVKGEVAVPLADYLVYLSEYHQLLNQHARVGLKSLTEPEAAQAEAGFSRRLQAELDRQAAGVEGQTQVEQSSNRVFDDIFEQLVREGSSPEQARAAASLWRGAMATMALEQKLDPWEFYSRMGLRVEGPARSGKPPKPRLAELMERERMKATLKAIQEAPPQLEFPVHPVLGILKARGGVEPSSTLAEELRNMGVTSQTHPGLYRKGGLEALDDLDIADEPVLVGNISRPDPESAYLDPNDLLAAIDAELRGNPLRSEDEHAAIAAIEEPMRELVEFLDELGIDPQAATVDQVLELLQRQGVGRENTEDPLEEPAADVPDGPTLEQPAFHGSPHRFSDFDITKIGTGEGAQAYGWGLYFTTSRGIAAFYRNTLSRRTYSYRGVEIGPEHLTFQGVAEQMERAGISVSESALVFRVMEAAGSAMADANDPQTWIDEAARRQRAFATIAERKREGEPDQSVAANYRLNAARLELLAPADFATAQGGQIVEVELPEDSNLLAWEKPLARQHADVKAALKRAGITQRFKAGQSDYSAPRGTRTDNGEGIYDFLTHELGSQQAASKALLAAGIVGHSYKAGQTAVAPTTTRDRNFVIYDDKAVRVAQTFYQDARGSVTFNRELTDVLIRLGKSRDASTFLHESGHVFLELLLRSAESPDASERIQNDARTILDWFGIASRAEMTTEHHEKFARGFEAYLRDGKAPSLELRDAFARFQAWLVKLYRTLTALNVEITEPVRQVMDRIVASDAAIETARRVSGFMPAFKDTFAGGMTEAEYADYHLRAQRVEDEQKRRLVRATLDDLERDQRAEVIEAQAEITEQVTADVNARPIFRLKQWLATGKLPDGTALEGLEHAKLDRDMLVDQFGKEIINILRPGRFGVWQARGGLDPRVVANVFGFQGAQQMVTMLAETSSRQEAIALEVEERLQKRFGDIFRDGRMAEAAIEALETTEQIDFLLIEERMLARRVGEQATPGQLLRETARRRIAEIKIRDLRPEQYRAQAQRAAIRVLEAVEAEDYALARDEKRAEILNTYLAREAEKAKAAAEKLRVYLLKMTKGPARARLGKAGGDYLEQVDALLFRFGFKPISNRESAKKETLQQWIKEQEASGARLLFTQKMLDETFTVDWKALTLAELDELGDLVKSIAATARTKTGLIASQDKRDLEEIRDELVTSIRSHVPREVPLLDPDDGTLVKLRHFAREAHGAHFKLEALFKRLDGGVLGPAWEAFFRPFAEAEARENEMLERVGREFRALFDALHEEGEVVKTFWIPEIGKELRLEQVLAIALNQGNEYNKTALIDGSGWNQQQVDAILDRLEERHWKAVVKIAKLIESFKEPSFELERELTGVTPKAVEPSHVVTKFGVLEGWYYPLKGDPVRSRRVMQREDAQSAQELFGGNGYKPMTRHNHLTERQGWGKTPVWLSLNVASEHLYNTIHDITHRKALIQVDRLTQDPVIADAIERAVGRELHAQIRPWLKGIAGERIVVGAQFIDRFFGRIRQGASVAYMGLKVSVMLTQGLGVLNAIGPEGVGARRFFGEMGQFLAHGPLEAQRRASWAISMSPALKARLTSFDREARDAVKRGIFRQGGRDMSQAFMATIGYCDMAITIPTWIAAYHRAIENGKSPDGEFSEAVLEADSVVRITMGSGAPKDLSQVQRGGELYRLFTMFYSAMNAIYAQQALTIAAIRDGRMTLPQIVSAAFYLWFLPAVLDDLIAGRGPDDDDDWWSWAASELAVYPAMSIVLARDSIGYGQNVARGEYLDFAYPAFKVMETTIRALVMPVKDLLTEGELKRSTVRAAVEAVGFWGKLPSRQAWITTESLYDLWTGQGEVLPQDVVLARPPERKAR